MAITFNGGPITLGGTQLAAGSKLGDFTLTSGELAPVTAADLGGKRVFITVPSIDTPVCDLEVRTFNEKAAQIPGVQVIVVSLDLPFAQSRFCGAAGIENVQVLSDYKDHSFAKATGTYIEELGLLTRAVFAVDEGGTVQYAQYVPEVTDQPDFDAALAAAKAL